MVLESTAFWSLLLAGVGALLYVAGGLRFRRWAMEDRPGIPRYPANVETIMLWLIYSAGVSVAIIVVRQSLRHF